MQRCTVRDSITAGVCPAPSHASFNDLVCINIRAIHKAKGKQLACRCTCQHVLTRPACPSPVQPNICRVTDPDVPASGSSAVCTMTL